MSSGSYYEEEMSSGGHRRLTAFILWPFSPSKKSPLDPPSPWSWLGAYTATSYADRVEFNTLYGIVILPRIRSTNRLWMPKWEMSLLNKGAKKCVIDKNTQITATYFTGTKAELADFGSLRIVSQ